MIFEGFNGILVKLKLNLELDVVEGLEDQAILLFDVFHFVLGAVDLLTLDQSVTLRVTMLK